KEAFDRAHGPYEEALRQYEAEQLPRHLADWERLAAALPAWETLEPRELKAKNGATLTLGDDGVIVAAGKNAKSETYTFTADTSLKNIAAFRLEALADSSLVKGGPGRAPNGNFALTDLKVTALRP